MFRRLFSFFLFFIVLNSALSQTMSVKKGVSEDRLWLEKSNDSLINDSKSNIQIQKNVFESSQKASPEVFYIVNDKPVSREEYLRLNKKKP